MDIFSICIGVALVGAAYFLYLAATKGLPAAFAWVQDKWNAGKKRIAALEADLAAVRADVNALKVKVATPIAGANSPAAAAAPAVPAPAPAAPAPAAPIAPATA